MGEGIYSKWSYGSVPVFLLLIFLELTPGLLTLFLACKLGELLNWFRSVREKLFRCLRWRAHRKEVTGARPGGAGILENVTASGRNYLIRLNEFDWGRGGQLSPTRHPFLPVTFYFYYTRDPQI